MKYKDYYQALGVDRTASEDDIKKAYRRLAHRYHPDVSTEPKAEEKFKEIAEAYATVKDPEKRREYDNLGRHPAGEEFDVPPEWQQRYGAGASSFDDVDLADILNAFRAGGRGDARGRRGASFPIPGEDYEVTVPVSLEKIYSGGETDVTVELPEYDDHGLPHRVPHTFRVTIPKGATGDSGCAWRARADRAATAASLATCTSISLSRHGKRRWAPRARSRPGAATSNSTSSRARRPASACAWPSAGCRRRVVAPAICTRWHE
jgi:curved DNA-binding protein CbpA